MKKFTMSEAEIVQSFTVLSHNCLSRKETRRLVKYIEKEKIDIPDAQYPHEYEDAHNALCDSVITFLQDTCE